MIVLVASGTLGSAAQEPAGPGGLTDSEQQAVRELAEKAIKDRGLWKGKIVLTGTEVVLDRAARPPERCVLLTWYRYEGNLGIVLTINLARKSVVRLEEQPDMPTSLTAEEIAEAEKMARGNAGVQKALANYKHLETIEADPVVAFIVDPEVPGYRHRVVRFFFRDTARNYLQLVPMVDVDLTTGEVRLDAIPGMHTKKPSTR